MCICCSLAHRLLYGALRFVVSLLFYIAIPIPEVIQCYHLFLHFPIVFLFVVFACFFGCFCLFLGFWCLLSCLAR